MTIVSPVAWYVGFWVLGAIVMLALVRVLWIAPIVKILREIHAELTRWP